ncbi:MAG: (Fe-S)-binding protein, partial [Halobacteriaceae archaeon]
PFHMLSSFANLIVSDDQSGVRLPRVPEDASPEDIGPSSIDDFSWKQLLDHDACTKCGRCSSVCPAKASGRNLDPRDVILDLKSYRQRRDNGEAEKQPIVADGGGVIEAESMEACMSCMACVDACPVDIEHVTQFTEMNRRLTESGQMDENIQDTMMDLFQQGNALGEPARKRPEWTDELEFDIPDAKEKAVNYLWYVGDYPSYDERNRSIARSLARIFEEANMDYGILYEAEQNDGNDVRRVGEEGLYEMLAEENIEVFEECEFDKIITTDPHSFNTFQNEYDQFGFERGEDVYHYTQVLSGLLSELNLSGDELDKTVTYHDPCHLGRYNGEYEAPREIIEATGANLKEMPRNRGN